jgi:hypothetical protein
VALAKVARPTEFSITDNKITTGEGSAFNSAAAYNPTSGAMTGNTVHNPYLMEALLTASIAQLKKGLRPRRHRRARSQQYVPEQPLGGN